MTTNPMAADGGSATRSPASGISLEGGMHGFLGVPGNPPGDRLIGVRDLSVRYQRRAALDGVSLDLGIGVHGLLGQNGAGKSTLMRVLATIARPQAGQVWLLGRDPLDSRQVREVRRSLGYLPQSFGFYPRFTVREFVEYFGWLKEVPSARLAASVDLALDKVGLTDRADERMGRLSGGMLRRAGIAQAVVNEPQLLLLDEPTAGLDPEQRVEFRELLRRTGLDACVLVSTHLVEDVAAACDDVLLLEEGRVLWSGTPAALVAAGEQVPDAVGDSPMERGYTVVRRSRR